MRPALLLVVLLTACLPHAFVTPYQPVGIRGGYTDTKLDDSTYVIDVRVNQYTSRATALGYFARRATDVCKTAGYPNFAVLEERALDTESGETEHYGRVRCR